MQKQKIVQKIDPDILQFLKGRKEVPVNTMIILINIVVFFLTELTGSSLDGKHLVQWGAAYTPLIQEGHEYYRFFTCMFLHFGLTHLGNNMLVLFFLGDCLERAVGHRYLFYIMWLIKNNMRIKYPIQFQNRKNMLIYISGGMGASLISYLSEVRIGENVVSAGASGAIFAVVGALIYVVIRNKGRLENFTTKKLLFLAALTLYHGVTSTGVDNAAHFGGFLCGFVLAVLIYRGQKNGRGLKKF